MNAREVIRLFDALPETERREVVEHVLRLEKPAAPAVRYASVAQVEEIAERVFTEHAELFRKLAQ